jgi:N-terminal region of glycosyl transferase group 7/N-terminal domain of galactosyltransferase
MSGQRLGIVVPFRDRESHLSTFLPHTVAYFERDKADKAVDVRFLIVEQPPGLPFNRGLMKNIGFQILRHEIDYVCFHDVDYLPMWADYSYPDKPSMLVGYGLEPPEFQEFFFEWPTRFFSAVVLLQNDHVERANGYSNDYWGWGHEDLDLIRRLEVTGLERDYRYGTFMGLDHNRDGHSWDANGVFVQGPLSQHNWSIYCARGSERMKDVWRNDGLSSLRFTQVERAPINVGKTKRDILIERVLVDFSHRPEGPGFVPTIPNPQISSL